MCCCCCCSVTQSCPTLCDPMDCSTPGPPVPHHLLEFAQVHVHCIGGAVQPSHPLMPLLPLPQESSPGSQFKGINSSAFCLLYGPALRTICEHWEDHSLDYRDLCWHIMSVLFNTRSRSVIAFLPRSNCFLILWLQSPSAVILDPKKKKSVTISTFSPSICHGAIGLDVHDLRFFFFFF